MVRHFVRLSQLNYGIDTGFYPLGSCTMKYNPKVNEDAARLPGFALRPSAAGSETVQGDLALMYQLQEWLKEIGGFAGVTPAAGGRRARRAHRRPDHARLPPASAATRKRTKILVPDSAHGTNPATTAMSRAGGGRGAVGRARQRRSGGAARRACDDTVAGLMLTNPNTLGLFEEHVLEVVELVHECGGLVYGDGANINALLGVVRPGDLGFDVMHYNLHKTFSTPHGGGGPGSGPVGVAAQLVDFLPGPIVEASSRTATRTRRRCIGLVMPAKTIGRVQGLPWQLRHAGARLHLHPHAGAGGPAGRWPRTRC